MSARASRLEEKVIETYKLCNTLKQQLQSNVTKKDDEIHIKMMKSEYDSILQEINFFINECKKDEDVTIPDNYCYHKQQATKNISYSLKDDLSKRFRFNSKHKYNFCPISHLSGLTFQVTSIHKYLLRKQIDNGSYEWTINGSIFITAALEYLCAEIVELAGNTAKDNNFNTISLPSHVHLAIVNDGELTETFLNKLNKFEFKLTRNRLDFIYNLMDSDKNDENRDYVKKENAVKLLKRICRNDTRMEENVLNALVMDGNEKTINREKWHELFEKKDEWMILKQNIIDFYHYFYFQSDGDRENISRFIYKIWWKEYDIKSDVFGIDKFVEGIKNHLLMIEFTDDDLLKLSKMIDVNGNEYIREQDLTQFFIKKHESSKIEQRFIEESMIWYYMKCVTMKEIIKNIDGYYHDENQTDFKQFECKINDIKSVNDSNNDNILNVFGENGIFLWIFDHLQYEELINNIHKTCKLFHILSLPILNKKYFNYICNNLMETGIKRVGRQVHADMTYRDDTITLIEGLLVSVLNDYVDKIKEAVNSKKCKDDDMIELLTDITKKHLNGELSQIAVQEGSRAIAKFKGTINDYKKRKFTMKQVVQTINDMMQQL